MNPSPVPFLLASLCFIITLTAGRKDDPSQFTGDVSINCGSRGVSAACNGRKWHGDLQQKSSSLLQLKGLSTVSTAIHKSTSADPVPYGTVRISRSQFSYTFPVNAGQKIIRLHFNPTSYKGFKGLHDLFSVEAGPFILLSNFSASLTADALGFTTFVKDFCLHINENKQLDIFFTPKSSQSIHTYAFVNGIEIISVPESLSYFHCGDNSIALEIVHRLKIKQDSVPFDEDFGGMFPTWATQKAEKLKSNTWKMAVEVGFRYLIRLHFSGLGLKISGTDDVMFEVLINGMVAYTSIEIGKERDGNSNLRYMDYRLTMRGLKREGKHDISISIQSHDELVDGHGVLGGFEVVKLSNPDNSLASPSPRPRRQDSPPLTNKIFHYVFGHRDAVAAFTITVICLVNILVHKLREFWEASSVEEENRPSARAERLCRRFSLAEIQVATSNFSDGLLIGRGGFGKVYKGHIDEGEKAVAIKRLKPNSIQGAREFLTEIETLSQLRHVNLVSLIGYCNEKKEMILVYEYMGGGTLADHLYKFPRGKTNYSYLTWKQRLRICIGAGRGLDYLHTSYGVIHRDIKASNILLNDDFVAKVCDFGLAKNEDGLLSHISTNVKGTFGYFDPSYFRTRRLTRKSDTYAFGVVLLEVLSGRPAVDSWIGGDEHILSMWARDMIGKGEVDQIVNPCLREEISPDSLNTFVGIAERCLCDEPKHRPTMSQVVTQLEYALEQQEIKQKLVVNEIESVSDEETDLSVSTRQPTTVSTFVQKVSFPGKEQNNSNVVSGYQVPSRKKSRRNSWPWGALLNRFKPSKKSELLLSVTDHSKTNKGPAHIQVSAQNAQIFEADIKLPKFNWATIVAATNRFSSSNLVGRGGFGKVYKAVLPTGKVVAVKRHSPTSSQALEDFKAEIVLLSNLQHRNVINLLGYCIRRDEKSYMPPEYLGQGKLSVKADVYSFGIIVLEIVSGRRVWNLAYGEAMMFLPNYAWKLWNEAKPLNLVDNLLGDAFPVDEALRCIQVGLLCTQRDPNCRPEMPSLLKILEGGEPQVELKVERPNSGPPGEDVPSSGSQTDEPVSNAIIELGNSLER